MTFESMTKMLEEIGLPYAYNAFDGPIDADQYIAYYETGKEPSYADNIVYSCASNFAVELYTVHKDPNLEKKVMDMFAKYETAWSGGDTTYIENEKVFMTVFYC